MRSTVLPKRIKIPVWDETRSRDIKRPVLLYEGNSCRIVDADCLGESERSGREIVVRWLDAQTIAVITWLNPQLPIQRDLRTRRTSRTVKCARRLSAPPDFRGDISSKMGVGIIERAADGHSDARDALRSRKSRRTPGCVSSELLAMVHQGQFYYYPVFHKPSSSNRKLLIKTDEDGWQVKDKSGWTLITESEARELLDSGRATLSNQAK